MVRPKARLSRRKDSKATVAFVSVAFCLLLLTGAYIWLLEPGHAPAAAQPIGGPFVLRQDDGRVVTEHDFRGQYMLIYFGYAHCADICPMTLSAIADALDILGDKATDLRPIFITVDPQRDTPAITRAYAHQFSPRILGLGGTEDEVDAAEKSYRVSGAVMKSTTGNAADYAMNHTAAIFLMGPDGRFLAPLSGLQGGPALAQRLAEYLPSKPADAAATSP
jgi:protein SCO1/2